MFERTVNGSSYRIAAESVWDPVKQRSYGRQTVLGPAERPPKVDLARTKVVGHRALGDVGALVWVAEQLDVVRVIDEACGHSGSHRTASIGEMVVAVALQRACDPGAKRDLSSTIQDFAARHCCLPSAAFSGQAFYRLAAHVTDDMLEKAQLAIAERAVQRFKLAVDALAFDTTNFDTFIATTTKSTLAQRGKAKSKNGSLRVVGLAVLASETGHVPLLYRTYPGSGADQTVLTECLAGLKRLHEVLGEAQGRPRAQRTIVRDGGSWGEQMELALVETGFHTIVSLPLGHTAATEVLAQAAIRGRMKHLRGALKDVRAYRALAEVGELRRTLVVVESEEMLRGQKRGVAAALRKAKIELKKLTATLARQRAAKKPYKRALSRADVQARLDKLLAGEHLSDFVVTSVRGTDARPIFIWKVDANLRRELEQTRLGRRVLCTDQHAWSTDRIVSGFRGQWTVEELFRRLKRGGVSQWGPAYSRSDDSLRLHTFGTVLGLTLASLAAVALEFDGSAASLMEELAAVNVTLVTENTGASGRRPAYQLAPELNALQRRAAAVFDLDRWMPGLLSSMT